MYGGSNQIQVAYSERRSHEVQNLRFNFLKYNGLQRIDTANNAAASITNRGKGLGYREVGTW